MPVDIAAAIVGWLVQVLPPMPEFTSSGAQPTIAP